MPPRLEGVKRAPKKRRDPKPVPASVFGPVVRADAPLQTAQRVARKRVQRAQARLPERPLPSIPILRRPTQRQAQTAVTLTRRATRKLTPAQKQELLQDPRSRAKLVAYHRAVQAQDRAGAERIARALTPRQKPLSGPPTPTVPLTMTDALTRRGVTKPRYLPTGRTDRIQLGRALAAALQVQAKGGPPKPSFHVSTKTASDFVSNPGKYLADQALRQVAATGLAFKHHPGQTGERTISGLVQQVVGLPAAVGELHREASLAAARGDVAGLTRAAGRPVTEAAADYARRYHGSVAERTKRIEKEGAAGEVTDALMALQLGGATAGRAFVGSLRGGAAGEGAARFASEARPNLRYSGGRAGVRAQELADRPTRLVVQRLQDSLRRKLASRPDSEGRVRGLQPGEGEVTPTFKRTTAREQRIAASRASARSYLGTRHEQAAEIGKGTERELAGLTGKQRRAVFHVTQGLVPLEAGVDAIRATLRERKGQILREQKARGVSEPKVLRKHTELRAIEFVDKHADEIFGDRRLGEFHGANLERQGRLAKNDPGLRSLTAETRRYRPQGEFLGIKYEPTRAATAAERSSEGVERVPLTGDDLERYQRGYITQVHDAAQNYEHGPLPEPGYFKHTKRLLPRLSLRTGGNVSKAAAGVKQSDLKLFREGRAVTNPDVLVQGLAENVKRKHQWNAVADVVDENAFDWSRSKSGGHSISSLMDEIDRRGLRHQDFTFLNLGIMRKAASRVGEADDALHDALTQSTVAGAAARDLVKAGDEKIKTRGFVALPKAAADELLANTRPSGKIARLFGRAQGLQSAGILGLNPSFLQVQVAANAMQAGAAMHFNPLDFIRQAPWYRKLSPDRRKVLDEAMGVGVYQGSVNQARLGTHAGALARTIEHIGQVPIVRTAKGTVRVTDVNPVNLIFRGDDLQNRAFRRTVMFNHLKRQAFGNMVREMGLLQASMRSLSDLMSGGGDLNAAAARLLDNPKTVEKAARHADDFLGDYLRFTAAERRFAKPALMFYGFMRFALKSLLYTLPVKHPLLGSIMLKLGQVHNEELRRIFGTRDVPSYALSRALTFTKAGKPVKTPQGTYKTVDFARINPLTTAGTEVLTEGPRRAAGVFSPLAQALFNVAALKNVGMDQPLHLHGSAAEVKRVGAGDIARVVGNEALSSLFPYRLAVNARSGGRTQSDDALLWSLRPITYKTADAQQREAERIASKGDFRGQLAQQLFPLAVPRIDRTAQSIRQKAGKDSSGLATLPPAERRAIQREADHVARSSATVNPAEVAALRREADEILRQQRR